MHKLIQFRDQGCQGAKEILKEALALTKNEYEFSSKNDNTKKIIYVTSKESNEKSNNNIKLWKEIASKIAVEFEVKNDILNITNNDVIILDEAYSTLLSELEDSNAYAIILDSHKADFESSYALPSFITLAYLSMRTNKPLYELSINWMGDAGTLQANALPITFLNASICTQGFYGFAFENNPAKAELYLPEKEMLDFAMGAGSKIYLTHEPVFLDDDADLLYIAPWTYKDAAQLKPQSHPYTFEDVNKSFHENVQIVSFVPEVQSSPVDEELLSKVRYNTYLATIAYILAI